MPRTLFVSLMLSSLLGFAMPAFAQDQAKDKEADTAHADGKSDAKKKEDPIPAEGKSETHHSVSVGGHSINYTANAGTLLIRDDKNKPIASVFYVAYIADSNKNERNKNSAKRPVTFFYNGGPGSSSVWLHMGSLAPVRVTTESPQATSPAPFHLIDNADTLLDKSDLVFIDAIGAGFSRPVGEGKPKDFWGVDQDVQAFAKAITRYVTLNNRWGSPKFLFGESYGTPRSAALVYALQKQGMSINGVVLLSSILNYAVRAPGFDHVYAVYLPSYAAIAWYHDKLAHKPAELAPFLDEVRHFAIDEYLPALAQGHNLSTAREDAIAQKLSQYTGLSVAFIKEAKLRVNPSRFRKELLRGQGLTVGRYDARFEGVDIDTAGENPEYDASDTGMAGAMVGAFHDYLGSQLKYTTELAYLPTNGEIGKAWDWHHKAPDSERPLLMAYTAGDLGQAMRENPHLKVLSANGYFDLATPFFSTEFDLAHMQLEPNLRQNLSFTYYPSGHMVYLNVDALKQFKIDLAKFYDSAVAP